MEIAISIFIGLWMTAAAVLAYIRLKKEYKDVDMHDGEEDK